MSNPSLATDQLLELLLQLKKTTPAAARQILNNQRQIAYALITLMVSMNAVNFEVFQRILAEYSAGLAGNSNLPPILPIPGPSAIPPHVQAPPQYRTSTPPGLPQQPQGYPNGSTAAASYPPPANYPPPVAPAPVQPPPGAPNALPDSLAYLPDDQKAMVIQLLSMTPEQINMLGPNERSSIMQLKATLGIP